MGFLKYIYFSQYYELKQKGKEDKAFLQANVLVATIFLFLAAAFYVFLLFSDSVSHDFDRFIETTFSIGSNRLNGKFLGLVTLLIIFIIVRFTIGRRKKYDKNIVIFNQLSLEEQAKQAKLGNYIFITVLFGAIFSVLGCLFLLD